MDLQIKGKTGLVTGASSGIGRSIAIALGAEGVRLALTARRRDKLDEVAKEIVAKGGPAPVIVEQDFMSDDAPAKFPPYDLYPGDPDWVPPSGCLNSAKGSSAELGKLLVDEFTQLVSGALEREFRKKAAARPRLVK